MEANAVRVLSRLPPEGLKSVVGKVIDMVGCNGDHLAAAAVEVLSKYVDSVPPEQVGAAMAPLLIKLAQSGNVHLAISVIEQSKSAESAAIVLLPNLSHSDESVRAATVQVCALLPSEEVVKLVPVLLSWQDAASKQHRIKDVALEVLHKLPHDGLTKAAETSPAETTLFLQWYHRTGKVLFQQIGLLAKTCSRVSRK